MCPPSSCPPRLGRLGCIVRSSMILTAMRLPSDPFVVIGELPRKAIINTWRRRSLSPEETGARRNGCTTLRIRSRPFRQAGDRT